MGHVARHLGGLGSTRLHADNTLKVTQSNVGLLRTQTNYMGETHLIFHLKVTVFLIFRTIFKVVGLEMKVTMGLHFNSRFRSLITN